MIILTWTKIRNLVSFRRAYDKPNRFRTKADQKYFRNLTVIFINSIEEQFKSQLKQKRVKFIKKFNTKLYFIANRESAKQFSIFSSQNGFVFFIYLQEKFKFHTFPWFQRKTQIQIIHSSCESCKITWFHTDLRFHKSTINY